jgi:hypothetical protein
MTSSPVRALDYRGLCEASAGAFLDSKHFVVASDETNRLQLYERGKPAPVGNGIDLTGFTAFDKSDIEGAAAIGDRVYWISSHSFNGKGKDIAKRKVFFATKIERAAGGVPTLSGIGKVATSLRDPLAKAAKVAPRELNIEALAATPEGGLLIGLRAPQRGGMAIVVPFKNPAAVVDKDAAPDFGEAVLLDLGGRGVRSMDLLGNGYIVLAGPPVDAPDAFVAYRWAGPGTTPVKIENLNLAGIRPEGAMAVPGSDLVQLLSDDGETCSDEDDPPAKRSFKSIDIKP